MTLKYMRYILRTFPILRLIYLITICFLKFTIFLESAEENPLLRSPLVPSPSDETIYPGKRNWPQASWQNLPLLHVQSRDGKFALGTLQFAAIPEDNKTQPIKYSYRWSHKHTQHSLSLKHLSKRIGIHNALLKIPLTHTNQEIILQLAAREERAVLRIIDAKKEWPQLQVHNNKLYDKKGRECFFQLDQIASRFAGLPHSSENLPPSQQNKALLIGEAPPKFLQKLLNNLPHKNLEEKHKSTYPLRGIAHISELQLHPQAMPPLILWYPGNSCLLQGRWDRSEERVLSLLHALRQRKNLSVLRLCLLLPTPLNDPIHAARSQQRRMALYHMAISQGWEVLDIQQLKPKQELSFLLQQNDQLGSFSTTNYRLLQQIGETRFAHIMWKSAWHDGRARIRLEDSNKNTLSETPFYSAKSNENSNSATEIFQSAFQAYIPLPTQTGNYQLYSDGTLQIPYDSIHCLNNSQEFQGLEHHIEYVQLNKEPIRDVNKTAHIKQALPNNQTPGIHHNGEEYQLRKKLSLWPHPNPEYLYWPLTQKTDQIFTDQSKDSIIQQLRLITLHRNQFSRSTRLILHLHGFRDRTFKKDLQAISYQLGWEIHSNPNLSQSQIHSSFSFLPHCTISSLLFHDEEAQLSATLKSERLDGNASISMDGIRHSFNLQSNHEAKIYLSLNKNQTMLSLQSHCFNQTEDIRVRIIDFAQLDRWPDYIIKDNHIRSVDGDLIILRLSPSERFQSRWSLNDRIQNNDEISKAPIRIDSQRISANHEHPGILQLLELLQKLNKEKKDIRLEWIAIDATLHEIGKGVDLIQQAQELLNIRIHATLYHPDVECRRRAVFAGWQARK